MSFHVPLALAAHAEPAPAASAGAAVSDKTLKRVDGSLHFIMFDQPTVFAADLDAFLAS